MWPPCCYSNQDSSSAVDKRQSARVPIGRHPRCTSASRTASTNHNPPTFVIVDIGTNNLSNGAPTVMVADAVVQLAHEIIDVFTDTCTWSRDGLHPNTNVGRTKYKRSLKKAVNHALSVMHKTKWYSIISLLTECTVHRCIYISSWC